MPNLQGVYPFGHDEGGRSYVADETKPRGHRFHTVSYQNKVQTYQFDEIIRIEGYNGK